MKISAEEYAKAVLEAYKRGLNDAKVLQSSPAWPEIRVGDFPPYGDCIVTNNFTTPVDAETLRRQVHESFTKYGAE